MKKITLLVIITLLGAITYGQTYSKIGKIGKYQDNWVLVEDEDGYLGFINYEGSEVLDPTRYNYVKIYWQKGSNKSTLIGVLPDDQEVIIGRLEDLRDHKHKKKKNKHNKD